MQVDNAPVLHIPASMKLPDNDQWQFRFEIKSATSNRKYIVSQNKKHLHWACSCPGYITHRTCKHLRTLGLPVHEIPYEPKISYK